MEHGRCLAFGEGGLAKFAEGLVAREDEQGGESSSLAHPLRQASGGGESARQSLELAAAIGTLAVDEFPGGLVDRNHAVELAEDRVF